MSGFINVIKSLFSGIFGFIGGLFGGKKALEGAASSGKKTKGYFLEYDESKSAPASSAVAVAAGTADNVPVAEQPMTVSKEAVAEATTNNNSKSAKTSTRKEKLAALAADGKPAGEKTDAAPATPQAAPVVTVPVAETAFATKYLVPANNGGRRRPGANMSSYLDMARKMNPAG
ncbi:MAG: hypothetical protein NW220_15605 [Leptolyngbyaceae cyanobacterium bins.349]|nr:hypothetical protein [Leptolyngbyaceae cyanobacterium bins.349]